MGFEFDGREYDTDPQGYLRNLMEWSYELGEAMAEAEGLTLTDEHWEVINFLREYYEDYGVSPPVRMLVRSIRQAFGEEKGNSRYLYGLFPEGPARQACKYAGLPKPTGCI